MNLKMQRPEPLADYMSKAGVPMPDYSREDERIYFSFSIKGFRTKKKNFLPKASYGRAGSAIIGLL